MITIWHNPRCSKSRATLALLETRGIAASVRLYLADAPSRPELEHVLTLLGCPPIAMMRRKDSAFAEAGLSENSADDVLIQAMTDNPALIERPIVITGTAAAIGRPPEAVLALFDGAG